MASSFLNESQSHRSICHHTKAPGLEGMWSVMGVYTRSNHSFSLTKLSQVLSKRVVAVWHHRIGENNLFNQIETQINLLSFREERVTVESTRNGLATKEICIENLDWAEIPHSFLCIGIHHTEL